MNMPNIACSFPDAFLKQMKSLLGEADFSLYLEAMNMPAKKGLRMNPLKRPSVLGGHGEAERLWLAAGLADRTGTDLKRSEAADRLRPIPWASGYTFEDPLRPGQSPLHEAGVYYIQEPSAMSAATLLGALPGERVLDLCAAPGGKSTQIAGGMHGQGVLVSNEPNRSRAKILSSNMERLGVRNSVVVSETPERLRERFPAFFDRILVDAPCSGEGMFRKDPETRTQWHENSPAQCAQRQQNILRAAAGMLRPGGTLVYSTCTFNRTENEEVIDHFLKEHPAFSLVPFQLPGLPRTDTGMQHLFPHEMDGEGHFLALLHLGEDAPPEKDHHRSQKGNRARRNSEVPALPEVFRPDCFAPERLHSDGRILWMLPDRITHEMFTGLCCMRTGLALCHLQGRLFEPDHAAGMALLAGETTSAVELTWENMERYQAGETLPVEAKKGYVLLQYEGISLGWGKYSDGMIKNHYPKGLRRRTGSARE